MLGNRGHFPDDRWALKVLFLVATEKRKNQQEATGKVSGWKRILNTLTVQYGDRRTVNSSWPSRPSPQGKGLSGLGISRASVCPLSTRGLAEGVEGMDAVTGAFGYTGRFITRRLLEAGREVRTLTGHPSRPDPFGGKVSVVPYTFDDPASCSCPRRSSSGWSRSSASPSGTSC